MTLLWAKDAASHGAAERGLEPDTELHRFTAGEDVLVDRVLFPFDLRATQAHVAGLARIEVFSASDAERVKSAIDDLSRDFAAGAFVLDQHFEDGHSAIEFVLTERLGDAGRRVHTGRSRNDQVQVAIRLYAKDRLAKLVTILSKTARTFLARAASHADVVMPGYTHLQRAVPSTVGLWLGGLAESWVDDAALAVDIAKWIDASPLGTGAGFGVNLPLDREGVARDLGFARVAWNPLAVQNARGKLEMVVLTAFEAALLDARRFAWDLSLFSMQELGFVRFPDAYTTGSSLMPNKRNPDVAELLRAAYASVAGARVEIASALSLPSGYQRDLQRTKAAFVRAVESALEALSIAARLAADFTVDRDAMRSAIDAPMFATDRAITMAREGVPFRDAYRRAKSWAPSEGSEDARPTPESSVAARVSPGACADLRLDEIGARLDTILEST